jgi:hypothetical protein
MLRPVTNLFDEMQTAADILQEIALFIPVRISLRKQQVMYRKKPDVDVIKDVLQAALTAYPASVFIQSLSHQYEERGGLSKKQLQGLLQKASKVQSIPSAKLATLEAEILKRPNRYKSALPPVQPLYTKNETTGRMIDEILGKYPQHKRVLFFKTKYDNNEPLSSTDINELERFHKLLH